MEFDFTEGHENFRQSIVNFSKTEMPPVPASPADMPSYICKIIGKISGRDCFGLYIPEEYGCIGGTPVDRIIYYEELMYNGTPEALYIHGQSFNEFGILYVNRVIRLTNKTTLGL